ncbi:M14 family zinc carboxypeptidase [Mycobacterium sp.]|uniref:M14 family zinc carboxypeptidase n=1 Tax=Mycobacterium sp. TaxID=1785 RepID=UPI003F983F24
MDYRDSSSIDSAVKDLVSKHPITCGTFYLDNQTCNGISVPVLRIQANPQSTIPVLFTGGVHGCELVPPDALLSFCSKLLIAFDTPDDITYPLFTDVGGITYEPYTIDNAAVTRILNKFSLFVVPCANPDGRDYSLSVNDDDHKFWRKNYRRDDDNCPGVDINRNFPLAWDADTYYTAAAALKVNTSKDPCSPVFRGYTQAPPPSLASTEPETQNLINLVAQQRIRYLVDVHMLGRTILYPWGMEIDQSTNASQTFFNTAYDHQRDGKLGSVYGEYVPNGGPDPRHQLLDKLRELADSMVTAIARSAGSDSTAVARSTYTAKQSIGLYPTTGAFDDYTFGQQFLNPNPNPDTTYAFTLECGYERVTSARSVDDDGGFTPVFTKQYPKVEREVHTALFGLLAAIS